MTWGLPGGLWRDDDDEPAAPHAGGRLGAQRVSRENRGALAVLGVLLLLVGGVTDYLAGGFWDPSEECTSRRHGTLDERGGFPTRVICSDGVDLVDAGTTAFVVICVLAGLVSLVLAVLPILRDVRGRAGDGSRLHRE